MARWQTLFSYLVKLLGKISKEELPLQFLTLGIFANICFAENAKLLVKKVNVLCQIAKQPYY